MIARISILCASIWLCATASAFAQATATPTPTPAPKPAAAPANPLKISGNARAFYFTRSNQVNCDSIAPTLPNKPGTTGIQCNAATFSVGGKLHADYQFGTTPWSLGASYFGSSPLGSSGNNPGANPRVDNSVPGVDISVLGEAYLQYKNKYTSGQIGREVINTPWATSSDSRITPSSFQGVWLQTAVAPTWTVGAYYMNRFRARTISTFNNDTLLTSCHQPTPVAYFQPEPPAAMTPLAGADPCAALAARQNTNGFAMLQVTKKFNPGWVANLYQYQVYDIVNITHIDTKYNYAPKSPMNPYFAAQYIGESDTGRALVGAIHAHMFGMQIGASLGHNIDFAFSLNQSPQTMYITNNCATVPGGIFGGVKGRAVPGAPAGTVECYGGGIASPYTDSYATDPIYTTTISQGMADVHKPGSGLKAAFTFQSNDRKLKVILAEAKYFYGLPTNSVSIANAVDARTEFNVDAQYFFAKVDPKKPYHGLSIRHRYAERITQFGAGLTPTSNPDFKYNRTQLEWNF